MITPDELADRLFSAIERGDVDAVRAVYADDVEVWHNNDESTQTKEESLRLLGWLVNKVTDLKYEEVRRQVLPSGFVQEHVLRFDRTDGTRAGLPACLVVDCDLEAGLITRIAEYVDSAHHARLVV